MYEQIPAASGVIGAEGDGLYTGSVGWPFAGGAGTVTQQFVYGGHRGWDISTRGGGGAGSPVLAVEGGVVVGAGWQLDDWSYGNAVTIQHTSGLCTRYAHQWAKRVRGPAATRPVELAMVTSAAPLVLKIGDATYSSADWTMYEPVLQLEQITTKTGQLMGASVDCSQGSVSSLSYANGTMNEAQARVRYQVGDLLAVQEMAGGRAFIILTKLQEVV